MATGNPPDTVGHADQRKAECERDTGQTDKLTGDHGCSATEKDKCESADQFGDTLAHVHSRHCSLVEKGSYGEGRPDTIREGTYDDAPVKCDGNGKAPARL